MDNTPISLKPTDKELLDDIKIMLDSIAHDTKTIRDDIHYIKISILSGKKLLEEQQKPKEDVSNWWWN